MNSVFDATREIATAMWRALPGGHGSDPPAARIALWITVATLATVALLMSSIVVLHLRNGWLERRRKRWEGRWLVQLLDPDGNGALNRIRSSQFTTFVELWNHIHDSMRGDVRHSLVQLSRNAGAVDLALARLRHGNLGERISSAHFLGNHMEMRAIPDLSSLASNPDPFLSLTCTRALVQIEQGTQLPRRLPDLLGREDWPLPVVHDILSSIAPDILSSHMPGILLRWNPEPPPRALRGIAFLHEDVRAALIETLFDRTPPPSPEAEAALLREIHAPSQLHLIRRGLDSPHWPVIVSALNRLASMGSREDVPRLLELLGHREWWVRYRAARALVMMPDMKPIEVELMATRHPDRYGREMLRYALAERNLR